MWSEKRKIKTDASREEIWNIWIDVKNWNKWDDEIQYSELNSEFKKGGLGIIKPKKASKLIFTIISVNKLENFTIQTSLPLSKINFTHEIIEENDERFIVHGVEITGILSCIFSRLIGKKLIKELPTAMKKLSEMAVNN